jgi:hypothetical protein
VPALLEAVRKPAPIQEAVVSKPAEPALATAPEVTVTSALPAELPPSVVAPAEPVAKKAPVSKKRGHRWKPDVEASIYAGAHKNIDNNGNGYYYGATVSLFLYEADVGNGHLQVGPSGQYVGWGGETGDVKYTGYSPLYGGDVQYYTNNKKFGLKVYKGKKYGDVRGIDMKELPYYAKTKSNLIALEGFAQSWDAVWQDEVGFRSEFASKNRKHSTWAGNPIPRHEDPAEDQDVHTVRVKRTYQKHKNFRPALELNAGWEASGRTFFGQVRPSVKLFEDKIEPYGAYNIKEGPKNDSLEVGAMSNLSNLVKGFLRNNS